MCIRDRVLFATGIGIGIGGVNKILGRDFGNTEIPGMIALAAAVVSIGVKEAMFLSLIHI